MDEKKKWTLITLICFGLGLFIPLFYIIGVMFMWKQTPWPKWLKILLSLPLLIILILSIFVIIYLFFYTPFQVRGAAMEPTYKHGAFLLSQVVKKGNVFQKGDIVIFRTNNGEEIQYIKRIIGLPGEKLKIENGNVYINDQVLDESGYLTQHTSAMLGGFVKEGEEITIPPNEYFALGDNRDHSNDSRVFGTVPVSSITHKIILCYWNCN